MTKTNPNDLAFYGQMTLAEKTSEMHSWSIKQSGGLTKREYFATQAMTGMLASSHLNPGVIGPHIAKLAVDHADAIIKELNNKVKVDS